MAAQSLRACCLAILVCAAAFSGEVDGSPYTNSWLGNTYGLPDEHVPHTIDNLCVTPSGKVATITGWDEGGHNVALYGGDMATLGYPVSSGTGAWGRNSGTAVFVDDAYVYQVMRQNGRDGASADPNHYPQDLVTEWQCIRRYNHNGSEAPFPGGKGYDGSMLIVTQTTSDTALKLSGVIVLDGELYVSEPNAGLIQVYNATSMAAGVLRSFAMANTGLLAADRTSHLWHLDIVQKRLVRLSKTGVLQAQSITLPAGVVPTAFCVDTVNDRILVANNGADQNILIYGNILGTPSLSGTFGSTGGINSGTPGAIAPLKFSEPRGVGIDAAGNIFVGSNSVTQGGARLEKYASNGALQWRLNGLIFTDNGCLDAADESVFYTKEFRLGLDLSRTSPGSEWSVQAMTLNKVRYPDDVRVPTVDGAFWTTAYVRQVSGRRLLFVSDMYGSTLALYRFNAGSDGETAIPSGLFSGGDGDETLWRDADGDGRRDTGETASKPADNLYSTHIFPDADGGVWKTNREAPVRYFPVQAIDAHGNPQYSYASSRTFALAGLSDVKRIEYDAASDALYATGRAAASDGDVWWCAGNRLAKYSHGATGPTLIWSIDLPYGAGDGPLSASYVKAFCQAGDYLFLIAARDGRISVHRTTDGSMIGEILPTADTGNLSGWSDIDGAVRATRRANGEYLIFAEENGKGKIMMYRWLPRPAAPSGLAALAATATRIDLTWTDNAVGETGFIIERKTGLAGTWAQIAVAAANATSFADTGLLADTIYSYRLRASNTSGTSTNTSEATATTLSAGVIGGTVVATSAGGGNGGACGGGLLATGLIIALALGCLRRRSTM